MNADTADMLEQYIALHEHSRDPQIAERVAKARVLLNEIDTDRADKAIADFRPPRGGFRWVLGADE